jgi:hypothetical protein
MAGYTVTNVTSDQVENANQDLVNAYDITFTVDPDRGQFTVQVLQSVADPVAAAAAAIQAEVDQVNAIYGLGGG